MTLAVMAAVGAAQPRHGGVATQHPDRKMGHQALHDLLSRRAAIDTAENIQVLAWHVLRLYQGRCSQHRHGARVMNIGCYHDLMLKRQRLGKVIHPSPALSLVNGFRSQLRPAQTLVGSARSGAYPAWHGADADQFIVPPTGAIPACVPVLGSPRPSTEWQPVEPPALAARHHAVP